MRKLLTILSLLTCFAAYTQTKIKVDIGSPNQIIHYPAIAVDSVTYAASGCGAPTINMTHYMTARRGGAYYLDTCTSPATLYLYTPSSNTWTFANSSTVTTGNVYYAKDSLNTPPGGPASSDVYMVGGAGTGAWSGHNYDIATWNGSSWDFIDPTTGDAATVTSKLKTYNFYSSSWHVTSPIPLIAGGNPFNTFLEFGTSTNNGAAWITNGLRRITVSNSGTVTFGRGSNAYTFPTTNSAGILTNNGTGTLTWSSSGTPTFQTVVAAGNTSTNGIVFNQGTDDHAIDIYNTANPATLIGSITVDLTGVHYVTGDADNISADYTRGGITYQNVGTGDFSTYNYATNAGSHVLPISVNGNYADATTGDITISTGSGTVTSIATTDATGIKGGTITGTGTLFIDTTIISTRGWRQKGIDSLGTILTAGYIQNQYASKQTARFWIDTGKATKFVSDTFRIKSATGWMNIYAEDTSTYRFDFTNVAGAVKTVNFGSGTGASGTLNIKYGIVNANNTGGSFVAYGLNAANDANFSGIIGFSASNSAPTIQQSRGTSNLAGKDLTIKAGPSQTGVATDLNAGNLNLSTDISEGTGSGDIVLLSTPAGTSGDNNPVEHLRLKGSGILNYAGNYGSLYTSRTLVDKGYVDSVAIATGSGTVATVGFTGGLISVANPTTIPAFTVAGTSGGIPYFSSTSTWASSALLAANALMIGGGAGVAPATTTTGTGVLAALGVNVGSAGAFVTFNGALGTPSSGTVTNLTGTAAINITGTVSGNTFTTGSSTYTGTAGQTYTFPSTTATIARTDAAQTFTGHNTFEGVTATGATGTGNMVFSAVASFSGNLISAGPILVNTTTGTFRLTNGGSNVTTGQATINLDGSTTTAGAQAITFETANGLGFLIANGTRLIERAALKVINATNTGGSESGDLGIYTQSAGTAATLKLTITSIGKVVTTAPVTLKGYTVATLPTGAQGDVAYVTDALAPSFLVTIVGGGSVVAPVFYNGTNWVAQ